MFITTPYLVTLLNDSEEEITETYAALKYDSEGVEMDICYCGLTDKITDNYFYIGSGIVHLTPQQLTMVKSKLETIYNNSEDIINESKAEFLEDLKFEQFRDDRNGL